MNLVVLLGNLGADAELRYTQGGTAVLKARLCTSETYKDKNGVKQEKSEWHNLTLWDKRAEALAKYLLKGTKIQIRGHLHYGSYEDKEGVKRYTTEIVVDDLEFAGGKRDNSNDRDNSDTRERGRSGGSSQRPQERERTPPPKDDDNGFGGGGPDDGDDIPF